MSPVSSKVQGSGFSALLMIVLALCTVQARADVRLPRIFTDHMVLQQQMPIRVWGWAERGEAVTVRLADKSASTTAGDDGRDWDYDEELAAMIASWRQRFAQPEMPFYLAQIAQTTYASGMERVWECQAKVAATVPHVYLGASNDLWDGGGAQRDQLRRDEGTNDSPGTGWPLGGTSNPHPPNKHLVANRLADIALVETYGVDLGREVFAPVYESHRAEGDKILVKFGHVGDGLKTDDGEAPNWFEVSDGTKQEDRDNAPLLYHKAQAKIVGSDTVEVWSIDVKAPKHVRLAWHPLARHNLYNSQRVPAINFRTDAQPTKRR